MYETAGQRCRIFREERKMTVEMLAKKAGVKPGQIRRFEKTSDGPIDIVVCIAVALEVAPTKLMTGFYDYTAEQAEPTLEELLKAPEIED